MGTSVMPEQDVVLKLKPDVELVCTKVEPEKVTKSCPSEPLARFKPKIRSVIPAKRRSVKRMMFDQMARSIAHVFRPRRPPASSQSNKPNSCFEMGKAINPQTP